MYRTGASALVLFVSFFQVLFAQDEPLLLDYDKQIGLHVVWNIQQGQTAYQLSRYLGVDLKQIKNANPDINLANIRLGQHLKLPLNKSRLISKKNETTFVPAIYTVKNHENWFRIARIYVDKPIATLKYLNRLRDDNLAVGQQIQLGWIDWPSHPDKRVSPDDISNPTDLPLPDSSNEIALLPDHQQIETSSLDKMEQDTLTKDLTEETTEDLAGPVLSDTLLMYREVTKKGIAFWDQRDSSAVAFLALHPSAPINSKIVLYNPMMDRRVVATVVSKLEKNSYPENISIVISPSVATALGALDRCFLVEMTYFE